VNAASNDLKELSRDVVKMKALIALDVSDNVIETLPGTICKMKSLRQLNVADNKIIQFPTVRADCMPPTAGLLFVRRAIAHMLHCKNIRTFSDGYFVASFPYFNETDSVVYVCIP